MRSIRHAPFSFDLNLILIVPVDSTGTAPNVQDKTMSLAPVWPGAAGSGWVTKTSIM